MKSTKRAYQNKKTGEIRSSCLFPKQLKNFTPCLILQGTK